jgi:hypothetical protein
VPQAGFGLEKDARLSVSGNGQQAQLLLWFTLRLVKNALPVRRPTRRIHVHIGSYDKLLYSASRSKRWRTSGWSAKCAGRTLIATVRFSRVSRAR